MSVATGTNGYQRQADLIKALAHPTRLQIMDVLSKEEACVCHLTTILKRRQPNVSQHLMVLREAGLVMDRKDGNIIYYRLAHPRTTEALAIVRDLLLAQDSEARFGPVPLAPIQDCPCPRCGGEGVCG